MTETYLLEYKRYLQNEERASATIEKYLRDIRLFISFLPEGKKVTKEIVLAYKKELSEKYKVSSVNSMLVALNGFLAFIKREDCKVKLFKVHRSVYRPKDRELTQAEYFRLVKTAKIKNNQRLCLLLQTICSTGIRVSEHRFITVESLGKGEARIVNKGKERIVFLPGKLRNVLGKYCKEQGLLSGSIFISKGGRALDRSNIWAEMKALCERAEVPPGKVFPHNLRHLFAVTWYRMERDIVHLADLLGHSNIDTTRIYTAETSRAWAKKLSRLNLLL